MEDRDRILEATAKASNVLLTGEELDEAVNKALKIIGESYRYRSSFQLLKILNNPSRAINSFTGECCMNGIQPHDNTTNCLSRTNSRKL